MGVLHSTSRSFGCNEEDERLIHPGVLHRRQNHYNFYDKFSRRLPNLGSFIPKAIKDLLQKVRAVFRLPWPRETADSVLPIQNPVSTVSREPLLVHTTLIPSPTNYDSSTDSILEIAPPTSAFVADLNRADEQELLRDDNLDVLSSPQWRPEEKQTDDVIVAIPDFRCSLAYASATHEEIMSNAVFIEEDDASRNVSFVEESVGVLDSIEWGKEEREEEKEKIRSVILLDEERWIKHYCSRHRILLVGEGDFSFSASLAVAFGCASNIIATSLDSEEFLKTNYLRAPSNIEKLRSRESMVMHGIDVTKMAKHASLGHLKFDRIIYNFPYAGLKTVKNLPRESQLRRHRQLVRLFLKNAREMISGNGEIHITHKTNDFHVEWKLGSLASSQRLRLIEAVKFNCLDYPGYNPKYGFGGDNNFNCNPSKTYKFRVKSVQH